MSTKYRPLLPATGSDSRKDDKEPSPKDALHKRAVTAACEECRDKKRGCSRERPTCEQCRTRNLECIYNSMPGETRVAALRARSDRMQDDLNTMMEIYWHLRTQPKEEAAMLLEGIQSGWEPYEILKKFRPSSQPQAGASTGGADRDTPMRSPSNSANSDILIYPIPTTREMLKPSNIISALEAGFDAFFSCTGCIFYVYDRAEAQGLLDATRECIRSGGPTWSDLLFRGAVSNAQKTALCSVCIIAAVGLQYTRDSIPAMQFVPSTETGTFRYANIFYEMTKHLLDATIESNILAAIKICATSCIFNTVMHDTVALANADMGINFALNLGPNFYHCPPRMSQVAWTNYKRVVRTLITLRGWLVTSLGFIYGDNAALQNAVRFLIEQRDLTATEIIQQELAKVIQIEANLLRTKDSFKNLSPLVLSTTRQDLAQWHEKLPQWMHLKALTEPDKLSTEIRRTVFLVHLFYLSANILVARLAHSRAAPSYLQYDNEGMVAAKDGLLAARTSARILQLQLEEQTIYQRCWLCIFTSYMSSIVLMHSTAQLLLHNYPRHIWQKELSHAKSCIDVLKCCAQVDRVAHNFAESTGRYHQLLSAQGEKADDIAVHEDSNGDDHLFHTPGSSPENLAQTSKDLLRLVSSPFGHSTNLHTEGILKAGFGSQEDWNVFATLPFNRNLSEDGQGFPFDAMLSGMHEGQFLGSSVPHGWEPLSKSPHV